MKTKIKKPAPIKKNELYLIKKKFLERNYKDFTAWGAGMKIMQELCILVPNIVFWASWTLLKPYPVYWLRTSAGKSYVLDSFEKWLKQQMGAKLLTKSPEKEYTLGDKVGEDFEQHAVKPKTLSDFLNE